MGRRWYIICPMLLLSGCHLFVSHSPRKDERRPLDATDRWDTLLVPDSARGDGARDSRTGGEASGGPLELVASDDAYVDAAIPAGPLPYPDLLWIGNKSKKKWTYLRFDLSRIPASVQIASATLKLCVEGVGSKAILYADVHVVASPWAESSVSWDNPPSIATTPTLLEQALNLGTEEKLKDQSPVELNVTQLVQAQIDSGASYGLRMVPSARTPADLELTFYAKERAYDTTVSTACSDHGIHKPTLVVTR